jgi:hypothetical protein
LYQVSNLGRIKRLPKKMNANFRNKKYEYISEEIIKKPYISNKGYMQIGLTIDKKFSTKTIHRLVAEAFIPNPNKFLQVNHIDGDKFNNNVENLEWCTAKGNIKHAYNNNLKHGIKGSKNILSKTIAQYDKDNNLINIFGSIREAERMTNIKNQSIVRNLKGKSKTSGGFIWRYVEGD